MAAALVPNLRRQVFCGSKRKQGPPGATCRHSAGWGTDHVGYGACRVHLGATQLHGRSVRRKNAELVAEIFGVPRTDIDPVQGLVESLQRSAGLIEGYEAMCAQLSVDEVVWGQTAVEESHPSVDSTTGDDLAPVERKVRSGSRTNQWVRLLDAERDRFARLCETMIKLDLDQRRLTFQQSQVHAIVSLMMDPELALNDDQRRVAARKLRELDNQHGQLIDGEVVAA